MDRYELYPQGSRIHAISTISSWNGPLLLKMDTSSAVIWVDYVVSDVEVRRLFFWHHGTVLFEEEIFQVFLLAGLL